MPKTGTCDVCGTFSIFLEDEFLVPESNFSPLVRLCPDCQVGNREAEKESIWEGLKKSTRLLVWGYQGAIILSILFILLVIFNEFLGRFGPDLS